jgi:acyl-CoA thioesterase
VSAEASPPQAPSILGATRVEPVQGVPGRYRATLSGDWNAPLFPSGGVVSSAALRAMQAALDAPNQRLRTFTTLFVSTVGPGPLEIEVETLRAGRRMSQLRAGARNPGSEGAGHLTTAAFGESREGFEFSHAVAPEVGPPEDYPGPADPPPGVAAFRAPFFENVDVRRVRLFHSFETGWEGGRAEALRWIRWRVPARLPDGRIDPLSWVALADTMPPAIGQYVGPGCPFFHAPSVDLVMRFFADSDEEWLLTRIVGHWAGEGYASAEMTLWDLRRRLVAHATQLMLIRFPEPAEPGLR